MRGNLISAKNRTRRTATRNTSAFLTKKWLNKLTSLLSKKGPGISQPGSLKPAVGITRRKEGYTSIKSDEEWTSRVLPSEQDDIVNSHLITKGIAVIELQFTTFLTVTDCVLALSQTK